MEEDQPESRVNEVLAYFGCKAEDLVTPVDVTRELLKKEIARVVGTKGRWTITGSRAEAFGWCQDTHYALEQILRNPIPGIHLSKSLAFGCWDWVAVKK
jgi:hypothetical protein